MNVSAFYLIRPVDELQKLQKSNTEIHSNQWLFGQIIVNLCLFQTKEKEPESQNWHLA